MLEPDRRERVISCTDEELGLVKSIMNRSPPDGACVFILKISTEGGSKDLSGLSVLIRERIASRRIREGEGDDLSTLVRSRVESLTSHRGEFVIHESGNDRLFSCWSGGWKLKDLAWVRCRIYLSIYP